ncbi:STAS domain-containing protein [Roseiflexus castenholzii]|jgi:anti-anti-sigma factor|uniref:Anti-sigma-factor antagonist n=1 Tax=Roseiflexus castenholzii (strain DSM 13941 / HLO8) TaxID=383372 RepID=A7NGT3_ROSCS|nr:STAS domain-containing protein [Roseiflexus castenholzii]ABU56680.1 anti-sigma-factor antagonist [Roseiflexus castenholzii DSM 13941]
MRSWINTLMTTRATDPDVQRRALIVMQLIIMMLVANVLFAILAIVSPDGGSVLIPVASSALFIGAYALAQRGYASVAAWIVVGAFLSGALFAVANLDSERSVNVGYFLTALIVIASLSLTPPQLWLVTGGVTGGFLLTLITAHPDLWNLPNARHNVLNSSVLLVVVGLVSYIGARIAQRTIRDAQQARQMAEQAQHELARANADLEERIAERTSELSRTLAAQQALTDELRRSLAAQQELSQLILDLSLPVIPVRDGTVVVPLSGTIDSARAAKLTESVLKTIEQRNVDTVILDITGVPIVDTQVAQALVRTASAARLMGAETILVGIRPEVAQTLIGLGIHLGLRTAATLQEGLDLSVRYVNGALRSRHAV